jgi:hypothetical protein
LPELAFQHAADASGQLARVTALRCFIAWFHNELSQAERYAAQALRDLPPADLIYRAGIFGALADFELRQAHLPNAAGYWRKALAAVHDRDNWGRLPLPLTGWVYIRLAEKIYPLHIPHLGHDSPALLPYAIERFMRGMHRSE